MSWDLLFNLEGAWNLYNGQIFHIDFHDPLGVLPFLLTEIGFWLTGLGPQAFLVGILVYAAFIFLAASWVAAPRLPLAAAAVVVYLTLLVLVPVNIGDDASVYTFAMSYNRLGWSGIVLLFVLLIFPPKDSGQSPLGDCLTALALLLVLFYVKITYFLVGTAVSIAALLIVPHIRRAAWLWALAIAIALVIAASDFPYWRDIILTAESGAVRNNVFGLAKSTVNNIEETTLLIAQLLCLVWLWRDRRVSSSNLAMALLAVVSGLFILSQNAQAARVPLYVIVSFLLFEALRAERPRPNSPPAANRDLLLLACLTPPVLAIMGMGMSLAGYWTKATRIDGTMFVGETNLRGLAVPADPMGLLDAFSQGHVSLDFLAPTQSTRPAWGTTQAEYVEMVLEAASIFRDGDEEKRFGAAPRIMTFDGVDPFPFMLGLPPPRGVMLWLDPVFPWPPAEQELGDVDVVLIPKVFTMSTISAVDHYGAYLRQNFVADRETMSWLIFRRATERSSSPHD